MSSLTKHSEILLDYMFGLWKDGALTDTVILCQGTSLSAHAPLLCAYSKYFSSAIRAKEKSDSSKFSVGISDLIMNLKTLKMILDYFYTGRLELTDFEDRKSVEEKPPGF